MDLWNEALAAKSRVEDMEAEVERARSAFHELVRQLNTSGASLREIASRVQLSHQRVHQIVEGLVASVTGGGPNAIAWSLGRECSYATPAQLWAFMH
jgi:hypothetical protein